MAHHQELSMQQRASPFVYWRYGLASQSDGSQCLHYNTVKDDVFIRFITLTYIHIYQHVVTFLETNHTEFFPAIDNSITS